MILKFFIVFASIVSVMGLLSLYLAKVALQYQYLRLKAQLKRTEFFDVLKLKLNEREREIRQKALLLFPLMFPIELENENMELETLKKQIKKIHLFIYVLIMVIMMVGIYSSKAFPNGIFNS